MSLSGVDFIDYGVKGDLGLCAVAGGSLYGSSSVFCLACIPYSCSLRLVLKTGGRLEMAEGEKFIVYLKN